MGFRVWLDDVRPMPEGFNLWYKNPSELLDLVKTNGVSYISFDNDLGTLYDGYWLAMQIESLAFHGKINPIGWDVHSDNPAGRKNINYAMESAWRFWYVSMK
jgi:hypothetical protein